MLRLDDTICAVATPPGQGGLAIVRLSGPASFRIADRLFKSRVGLPSQRPSHTLLYGDIVDPATGDRIDDAVALLFRSPRSYTGEDVVEFSCHGGPVTVGRVLQSALAEGARPAQPGEFTQRAYLNGRMDLAQAEAVCDQIQARTEAAQRVAARQREGALSQRVAAIRHELVGILAAIEVTIDFSEEVGDLDYPSTALRLAAVRREVSVLAASASRGRVYRDGVRLAIIGRPNVGKSSLMNALLRENRAIVTPIAGTTRDVIEEAANICGIPITAIDTAGLRETEDAVERIGVERARASIGSASLALFVLDAGDGWTAADAAIASELSGTPSVWVINKTDLVSDLYLEQLQRTVASQGATTVVALSVEAGTGLDLLEQTISQIILGGRAAIGDDIVVSNARHQAALEAACESLERAEETTAAGLPPDFISIDVRAALDHVGQITGETATDEIVHRIFHDFCVGK